ncbi:MAG: ParA family protein [Porticoccaceae bacterium]
MTRTLAIANQKGGVGKTTTSVNLVAALASYGKRVLLVDMDPQGNATMGSGVEKATLEQSIYDVLATTTAIADAICTKVANGYDLLPANSDLTAAEVELLGAVNKERRLDTALAQIRPNYDYILIDCPPALSMLTVNALAASDGVIIPMQCEYYALEGLSGLVGTIARIGKLLNPKLRVEGLLRTMYDPRSSLTNEVSNQLHRYFGDRVYRTVIPRNVRLAEAPSHGQPVLTYDRYSKGATAYLSLAAELIQRGRDVTAAAVSSGSGELETTAGKTNE